MRSFKLLTVAFTTIGISAPASHVLVAQTETCPSIPISNTLKGWLVGKVCAVGGVVQNVDPCTCNSIGGTLQDLKVGEPLAYHRWNEQKSARIDVYPVCSSGQEMVVPSQPSAALTDQPFQWDVFRWDDLNSAGLTNLPPGLWPKHHPGGKIGLARHSAS